MIVPVQILTIFTHASRLKIINDTDFGVTVVVKHLKWKTAIGKEDSLLFT